MKYLVASLFIIPGLINFAPIVGALSNEHISRLYQIENLSPDVALLLRHRAFLFGIIGVFLICSAFQMNLRTPATLAALVSMVSFTVLVFVLETSNPNLIRVAWIDIVATVVLLFGYFLHTRLK